VIIPERAHPSLLRECLESVAAACRQTPEPSEVIVVVNGSPRSLNVDLARAHGSCRWIFSDKPLWYAGAVRAGLRAATYDWVYLLNNDTIVDPRAFCSPLGWRSPSTFAIASQVYFRDRQKRREETGWTMFRKTDGPVEILDEIAADEITVRGTLYAGGGAHSSRNVCSSD
jgi:GT2 family glycosyltransferase